MIHSKMLAATTALFIGTAEGHFVPPCEGELKSVDGLIVIHKDAFKSTITYQVDFPELINGVKFTYAELLIGHENAGPSIVVSLSPIGQRTGNPVMLRSAVTTKSNRASMSVVGFYGDVCGIVSHAVLVK